MKTAVGQLSVANRSLLFDLGLDLDLDFDFNEIDARVYCNNTGSANSFGHAVRNGGGGGTLDPSSSSSDGVETLTSGGGFGAAYRIVVDVYVVGALCLFGFLGNAMLAAVLRADPDRHNNTTNWLLQSLAAVDTLYLAARLCIQPLRAVHDAVVAAVAAEGLTAAAGGRRRTSAFYPAYAEPFLWVAVSIAQTATVWAVVLVTVDRYVAVCLPTKTRLRSLERAKAAVAGVVVGAVLYNVPVFFEHQLVEQRVDVCSGEVEVVAHRTLLHKNKVSGWAILSSSSSY